MIIKTFVFRDTSCPGEYGFVEEHTNGTLHLERIEQEIQETIRDFLETNPGLTEVNREIAVSATSGSDRYNDPVIVTICLVTCYFEKDEKAEEKADGYDMYAPNVCRDAI